MSTVTAFDLGRFARAAEERDASTQLSMYGADATVTIVDTSRSPARRDCYTAATRSVRG